MESLRNMIKFRYLLAVVMLSVLAAVACSSDPTATAEPSTASPPVTQTPGTNEVGDVAMLQLPNIADTVEKVRPAVVSIVARIVSQDRFGRQSTGFGSGTGVIFDESGLVLTNNHVIEGGVEITVTQDDGTQIVAELIGADLLSDLAVLQIPGDGYPFLPLHQNGPLRVGDWVIAIGNALALPGGPTVTVGVVSALGRSIESTPGVTLYDLIQTDTSINPRRTPAGDSIDVEGIGFAIDVETAQQVAEQLVELGRVRWVWMGVFLADLVPEVAAEVGLPIREGVIIRNTVVDGPSDRAGIIPGDIVVNIAGQDIATVSDLTRLLKQELRAGQQVEVEVFQIADGDGSRKTLTLELGERPQQ